MSEPLLTLCMIVRDERDLLARCIDSAAPYVDQIVAVDTGSTDGTPGVAEKLGAQVVPHPWQDDFSAARNTALDQAHGRFVLMLDADEWIEAGPSPGRLRRNLEDTSAEALSVELHDRLDGDAERYYPLVRLFRNRPDYRYRGTIHEQITPAIAEHLGLDRVAPEPSALIVGHDGYRHKQRQAHDKSDRNLRLLRRQVTRDPGDAAMHYFLVRELVPFRGGRAVPGAHLMEPLAMCEQIGDSVAGLVPELRADMDRLHAAALLAVGRVESARAILEAHTDEPAFALLKADAALALHADDPVRLEAEVERLLRCNDGNGRGELPFSDPALAGSLVPARIAEILARLGRIDEARAAARQAAGSSGGAAAPWNAAAAVERAAGDSRAALAAYLRAVRADGHDPWSWLGLGETLLRDGQHVASIEPLSNVLRLAPGWDLAEEALAAALFLADRFDEVERRLGGDYAAGPGARAARSLARDAGIDDDPEAEASACRILGRLAIAGCPDLLRS